MFYSRTVSHQSLILLNRLHWHGNFSHNLFDTSRLRVGNLEIFFLFCYLTGSRWFPRDIDQSRVWGMSSLSGHQLHRRCSWLLHHFGQFCGRQSPPLPYYRCSTSVLIWLRSCSYSLFFDISTFHCRGLHCTNLGRNSSLRDTHQLQGTCIEIWNN